MRGVRKTGLLNMISRGQDERVGRSSLGSLLVRLSILTVRGASDFWGLFVSINTVYECCIS